MDSWFITWASAVKAVREGAEFGTSATVASEVSARRVPGARPAISMWVRPTHCAVTV